MPTYLHPGVYIEEIPSGARPIEGVATSVAAFVGAAHRGPANDAVLIHGLNDYETSFGPIASETDAMGLAVAAFYLNGGKDAYICRLVSTAPPAAAATVALPGQGTGATAVIRLSASSVGTWGNAVYYRIRRPVPAEAVFTLELGHLDNERFQADETFANLRMDAAHPDYLLTRVNGVSQLASTALIEPLPAGALQRGSLAGGQVGAGATYFSSVAAGTVWTLGLNLDGLGVRRIALARDDLALAGDNAADGDLLAAAVQTAVRALSPSQTAFSGFTCAYDDVARRFTLSSGTTSSSSSVRVYDGDGSAADLALLLALNAAALPTAVHGSANLVPAQALGTNDQGTPLAGGVEGPPAASDYTDFFDTVLRKVRDVSIIVLPGQAMAADGSGNAAIAAAVSHCEATGSRMVIVDPPPGLELDQGATVDQLALSTSTYAVLYYPWVRTANPFYNADSNPNAARTLTIAPSALAAGMWSKIDGRRGVWKAPAGVETALLGVAGLEFVVEDGEQDQLNPLGVNCLRTLPGFGPVIWGTRTLSTNANPEWRYVPVRRTAIFIERSIYNGIQWAVFEPNDHRLWSSLRANIGSFMNGLFRAGAFQGEKANDAYFVRCGLGDTMTQGDIDRGQVIVIVGFAPLKPAEFVIVRIQQKVGQE